MAIDSLRNPVDFPRHLVLVRKHIFVIVPPPRSSSLEALQSNRAVARCPDKQRNAACGHAPMPPRPPLVKRVSHRASGLLSG